jgi:hypothetical protein
MTSIVTLWLAYEIGAIAGRARRYRVKGPEDRRRIAAALRTSPVFQQLAAQGLSRDEIIERLDLHRLRGKEFERVLGVPWPL